MHIKSRIARQPARAVRSTSSKVQNGFSPIEHKNSGLAREEVDVEELEPPSPPPFNCGLFVVGSCSKSPANPLTCSISSVTSIPRANGFICALPVPSLFQVDRSTWPRWETLVPASRGGVFKKHLDRGYDAGLRDFSVTDWISTQLWYRDRIIAYLESWPLDRSFIPFERLIQWRWIGLSHSKELVLLCSHFVCLYIYEVRMKKSSRSKEGESYTHNRPIIKVL